jgi:hypothetical protein
LELAGPDAQGLVGGEAGSLPKENGGDGQNKPE